MSDIEYTPTEELPGWTLRVKRCWANVDKYIIDNKNNFTYDAFGGLASYTQAVDYSDCYIRVGILEWHNWFIDYNPPRRFQYGLVAGNAANCNFERIYTDFDNIEQIVEGNIGELTPGYYVGFGIDITQSDVYINSDNKDLVMVTEEYNGQTNVTEIDGVHLRTTEDMTIPYAPNTYLNFDWNNVWYSYESENDTFPILVEKIIIDDTIYFINEPTITSRQITANHIIVSSSTATYELAIKNLSKDRYITRYIEIEEGDLDNCRQVAEALMEKWSKKALAVEGEIPLRQNLNFKKEVTVIVPEYDLNKSLPIQKIQHDVINQRTQITAGDLILNDNELLSRILERIDK